MSHQRAAGQTSVIAAARWWWCLRHRLNVTFTQTKNTTSSLILFFQPPKAHLGTCFEEIRAEEINILFWCFNAVRDRVGGGKCCAVTSLWNPAHKQEEVTITNIKGQTKSPLTTVCSLKINGHNITTVIMWLLVFIGSFSTVRRCEHHFVSYVAVLDACTIICTCTTSHTVTLVRTYTHTRTIKTLRVKHLWLCSV